MKQIQPTVRIRDGLVTILSLVLAGVFLGTGFGKVIGYSEMVGDFARWGYPEGLVVVAAALEITGALLILMPRLASVGASLLAISMCGAFLTHLVNGQAGKGLLTAALLALVVLVAVARWPRSILRSDLVHPGTRPASHSI
ncbi:MAG TPA: DoxX family protein [Rhodothermales bacterium]